MYLLVKMCVIKPSSEELAVENNKKNRLEILDLFTFNVARKVVLHYHKAAIGAYGPPKLYVKLNK